MAILTDRSLGTVIYRWGIQLAFWAFHRKVNNELRVAILIFTFKCVDHYKKHGLKEFIFGLKFSFFALNSYLSGNIITSCRGYDARMKMMKDGLPAILPALARKQVRSKDPRYLRIWSSLLFSYKGMQSPYGDPNFRTIEAPRFNGLMCAWSTYVPLFIDALVKLGPRSSVEPKSVGAWIVSSSPNCKVSIFGAVMDAVAWSTQHRNLIREWMTLGGDSIGLRFLDYCERMG
jgi:hypothetical protein